METWLPVPGFQFYSVSDHGRVRVATRTVYTSNNQARQYRGGLIVPCRNQTGHQKVLLSERPGKKVPKYVHALVMEAFVGPRPDGYEVAHNDGNPANNHVSNLRYATAKENAQDKRRHGTLPMGERHPAAKLSDRDVVTIRSMLARGDTQKAVAAKFKVSRPTIGAIAVGRSWRFA